MEKLRKSLKNIGEFGKSRVSEVRRTFETGITELQRYGSGSVNQIADQISTDPFDQKVLRSLDRFGLSRSSPGSAPTVVRPELDYVEIGNDRFVGELDNFFCRIVVSIPRLSIDEISNIRLLRCSDGPIEGITKPSISAMIDGLPQNFIFSRLSDSIIRSSEQGVPNVTSDILSLSNPFGRNIPISSEKIEAAPLPVNSNRQNFSDSLIDIRGDKSVVENLQFAIYRNSVSSPKRTEIPQNVAVRKDFTILPGQSISRSSALIESSNDRNFVEIVKLIPGNHRIVGDFIEFEYYDHTVTFGGRYTYYAVCCVPDKKNPRLRIDGPRSRMVTVDVIRMAPPSTPSVLFDVSSGNVRIDCRGKGDFLDHIEIFRKGGPKKNRSHVLATESALSVKTDSVELDSGFFHITDVPISQDRSCSFVDRNIPPGAEVFYRVYLVDSFGLKSSTPFSFSVKIPGIDSMNPMSVISLTAEQTIGGRAVRLSVATDRDKPVNVLVGRRDVSLRESSFRQPTQPDISHLSAQDAKRTRAHNQAFDRSSPLAWSGAFIGVTGTLYMDDLTVQRDHIYQYSADVIGRDGSVISRQVSEFVTISNRPIIDHPASITSSVELDPSGEPSHVRISWDRGTVDFSVLDLIGDQNVLAASSERSVFQVERREIGKSVWKPLPAVTGNFFIDEVGSKPAPSFRPEYVSVGLEYEYRVFAMQSGGYISNRTEPVRVAVLPPVSPPQKIWVRSSSTAVRPLLIAVSWDYRGSSIDRWIIERAVVNKIYGARINSIDSEEIRSLDFKKVAEVHRESSRSRSISSDSKQTPNYVIGNRSFIDSDVDLLNNFFYRIAAVDISGKISEWVYCGISMIDSPFDRKFFSTLSDDEKNSLSKSPRKIDGWGI